MAKETITRLKDDLDGSEAKTTIQFSWGGTAYEIDLSGKNSRAFEEAIAPYLAASRRVSGKRTSKRPAAKPTRATARHDLAAVRAWAASNGTPVASRGRIATAVIEAYHAAQNAVNTIVHSEPAAKPARKAPARKAPVKRAPINKSTPRKAAARKNASQPAGRKTVVKKATVATPTATSASA